MTLMQELADLNNAGVSLFIQGDLPNAIEVLRRALHIAKQNCRILAADSNEEDEPSRKRIRRSSSGVVSKIAGGLQPPVTVSDELLGVHTTGILIEDDFCDDEYENAKCASATVIFNLALAFHMKSQSESGCQTEMQKARTLYLHVYGIVSGVIVTLNANEKTLNATGYVAVDFLYMVATNNTAYANLDVFGDQASSAALFRRLACFALSFREKAMSDGTLRESMDMQLEHFLQNAFFARVSSLVTAPAA